MESTFPENFSLQALDGPRGQQFSTRQGAFQALVGDAVLKHDPAAQIAPLHGPDGAIDAYITRGEIFQDLPAPVIVECKAHDDETNNHVKNIFAEWRKLAKQLSDKAADEWPDKYRPWREIQSYLYCISGRLSPEDRRNLENEILDFFRDKLSYPLNVRVMDWHALRDWLDHLPRVRDLWLSLSHPAVWPHDAVRDALGELGGNRGFERYLHSENLTYIPPDRTEPWHPDTLFETLKTGDDPGQALVGPGGVGKTRTVFEVGQRAENDGWRVLHIRPGEQQPDSPELDAIIRRTRAKQILFIVDYLDESNLITEQTITGLQRNAPNIRLRFLATARPRTDGYEADSRFAPLRRIDLMPTEKHNTSVIEAMIDAAAPNATEMLGRKPVQQACGRRPIIALLILREIERLCNLNQHPTSNELESVYSQDLFGWLRKRLREAGFEANQGGRMYRRPRVDDSAVAAATGLVLVPIPETEISDLDDAIRKTLAQISGTPVDQRDARDIRGNWSA